MLSKKNIQKLMRSTCIMLAAVMLATSMLSAAADSGSGGLTVVGSRPVDVALAVGNSTVDFSDFADDLLEALTQIGTEEGHTGYGPINASDVNIIGVKATEVSTSDSFAWLEFDHSPAAIAGKPFVELTGSQSTNAFNAKERHIVSNETGTMMTFYGYGSSAYSDFMLLENNQRTTKEFTFAIKEYFAADALGGMGFFFNSQLKYDGYANAEAAYADGKLYLDGYLMFLQYSGQYGQGIVIYKATDLNLKNYHHSSPGAPSSNGAFTLIASSVSSGGTGAYHKDHDLRKFRIVAKPSSIEVFYQGFDDETHSVTMISDESAAQPFSPASEGYKAFTAAEYSQLPAFTFTMAADGSTAEVVDLGAVDSEGNIFGGASFGPMAQYLGHGCERLTKVELSELSMKMDVVRSLVEVVREPEWRSGTDRFVVYINDTSIDDFKNESSTGELLNRLYEDNIYYVGWANEDNASASGDFISSAPGGIVIDRSRTPEGKDEYAYCIEQTAKAIYERYWKEYEKNTFVTGEDIKFGGEDVETENSADKDWPEGKWYIVYDNNSYLGMATHPSDGTFISSISDFDFSIPGKYDVYYEYDTNNKEDNDIVKTIIVHRQPVAAFSDDYDSSTDTFTLESLSFDPDVIAEYSSLADRNGISTFKWAVEKVGGTEVSLANDTAASVSFAAQKGALYLATLTVTDSDGGTTVLSRQIAAPDADKKPVPMASFQITSSNHYNNVTGYQTVYFADNSYALYQGSNAITYDYRIRKSGASSDTVAKTGQSSLPATLDISGYAAGTYTVYLTIKCGDQASAQVSKTFTVKAEPNPVLKTSVDGFELNTGDYIFAGKNIKLEQTDTDIITDVNIQYNIENDDWVDVATLSAWSKSNQWIHLPMNDADGKPQYTGYTFRATAGGGGNISDSVTVNVVPTTDGAQVGWSFEGASFDADAGFSSDAWYGTLDATATGIKGNAPLKKDYITATATGETKKESSAASGGAKLTLDGGGANDDQVVVYTVVGKAETQIRTSATGYYSVSDTIYIRIDPAIDAFIAATKSIGKDSTAKVLKDAKDYYDSLGAAQKDHISKNPVAAEKLAGLNDLIAQKQEEIQQEAGGKLDAINGDAETDREDYEDLRDYYNLLGEDVRDALDPAIKAEYEEKIRTLDDVEDVLDRLDAAKDSQKGGYDELKDALGVYGQLSQEAKDLLTNDEKAAFDALADIKDAVDSVADIVADVGKDDKLTPESLDKIKEALGEYEALTNQQEKYVPDSVKGRLEELGQMAQNADTAQKKINAVADAIGGGGTPSDADVREAYREYEKLTEQEKRLVDSRVDGSKSIEDLYKEILNAEAEEARKLSQLEDDILILYDNPAKTIEDIQKVVDRFTGLSSAERGSILASTVSKGNELKADLDAVKELADKLKSGQALDSGDSYAEAYDKLTPQQKELVDRATDNLGKDNSLADAAGKKIEDALADDSDDRNDSIEAAMDEYIRLSDQAKALLPSALTEELLEEYAEILSGEGDLKYINSKKTDDSETTVTIIGMVNKVELPASAGEDPGYSTLIELRVKDSQPEKLPEVDAAVTENVLSVDVKLWAQVYIESGSDIEMIEEVPVQPKQGEAVSVLIEIPAQYAEKPLEIYHVKDNGLIKPINDYSVRMVDGTYYLLISLGDFSHIVVYAEKGIVTASTDDYVRVVIEQTEGGTISPVSTRMVAGAKRTFTVTPNPGYIVSDVIVNGKSLGPVSTFTVENVRSDLKIQVVFARAEGLPYYYTAEGQRVFVGYSSPKSGEMRWIAPADKAILFVPNPQSFTDVSGSYAESAIYYVAERQLMSGQAGEFAPRQGVTRAMFVDILGKLHESSFGVDIVEQEYKFDDVDYDASYGKYISWAEQNGIILGISDTLYAPDRVISRQEMAAILHRYAAYIGASVDEAGGVAYADEGQISAWALDSVRFCQQAGLMTGTPSGFSPHSSAVKGDVAIVIHRLIDFVIDSLPA